MYPVLEAPDLSDPRTQMNDRGNIFQPAPESRPTTRQITRSQDIVRYLRVLCDHRGTVRLTFEESGVVLNARLLDVHDDSVLIQDIHPKDGVRLFARGETFSFTAEAEGMFVFFESGRVEKAVQKDGLRYYHIALPSVCLVQQRHHPRVWLPQQIRLEGSHITLIREGGTCNGEIVELSPGGCRAEFREQVRPRFKSGESIQDCRICLSDVLEIKTKAAIRHLIVDESRHKVLCGIEFTRMDVTSRRRLEYFIETAARLK